MYDSILVARNVQLTFRLKAKEIYISPDGSVTIIASQIGPHAPCPSLSVEYLESLCCSFYYGGKFHKYAIADIMLLNHMLRRYEYGGFYDALRYNLESQTMTIISSEIFR